MLMVDDVQDLECEKKENALVVCITKLLLSQEIPRQWQDRVADFRTAMSQFAHEHVLFSTQVSHNPPITTGF
jgi:hypothetical protein